MLSFLLSIIKRFLPHGIIGAVLLGLITFSYHAWHNHVYNEALTQFNQAQVKQNEADNAKFKEVLQQLQQAQDKIAEGNQAYQKSVENQAGAIEKDTEKGINRPASDLLKHTVDQLRTMR